MSMEPSFAKATLAPKLQRRSTGKTRGMERLGSPDCTAIKGERNCRSNFDGAAQEQSENKK
jgi:hypothetical protein